MERRWSVLKILSDRETDPQIYKYLKRNWFLSYMDGILIIGGMGFVSVSTVLTYFVSEFTDSRIIIGLFTSIFLLGKYLPQMLGAKILEGLSHNKGYVNLFGLLQRLPWFGMAFITYRYALEKPSFTLLTFYLLYGFYTVASGMFNPGWLDLIAKVIPVNLRGRFFGIRKFLGGGMQFFGSFVVAWLFTNYAFPTNYTIAFLIAGISSSISYLFLINMKEVGKERVVKKISLYEYTKKLPTILKDNRNFSNYIIASMFIVFYNMATAFYIIYGKDQLGIGTESVGILTGILLATQSMFSIFWGYVSDKKGHKFVLIMSTVLFILSTIIIYRTQTILWLYIVFFINGAATSAREVSEMNIVLEFSEPEDRPTYLGLNNTLIAPLVSLTPLFGGIILDYFSYKILYILSILLMVTGLVVLGKKVKDPRYIEEDLA